MKRAIIIAALCALPLPGLAGQIGLVCTGETVCIQSEGCAASAEELTVFIGALGNPDRAIVHIGHESLDAARTDNHLAFTFRSGEARYALQIFNDNKSFSLMGVDDDGRVQTLAGNCEAIE